MISLSTAKSPLPFLIAMVILSSFPSQIARASGVQAPLVRSSYAPGDLSQLCASAISKAEERLNSLSAENPLFDFEKILADFGDQVSPLTFMSYVSTDEAVSKEASECEQKVSQFSVAVYTRKDLYQQIRSQKIGSSFRPFRNKTQENRLLSETIEDFEENGLKLPDDKLDQVRELKKKLAVLESQFSTQLNQDETSVEFTAAELEGLPPEFIRSLPQTSKKQNSGSARYTVSTKEPVYVRVMENAVRSETRRKMMTAYETRAGSKNTELLEKAIELRQEIAQLMGYPNWADYRLRNRMAKNSKNVLEFLTSIQSKLVKRNKSDLDRLVSFKKELDPSAQSLDAWDLRYYAYQLKKKDYNLDDELIRPYFPMDRVIHGLFEVYSKLLGVIFVEDRNAKTWAEGVKLYRIIDPTNKVPLAYFYTDFLPRKGKYGHAAAFPLISGRMLDNGKYSRPVAAIVANFTAAESGKPMLLKHEEVRTLFHEFGHIMHQTLTRAPYASLSGANVDQDFVEAPSQMLENWIYDPEILSIISGHYQNHSKKIPPEMLKKIIASRDFNLGYFYTRQLLFGLLDMGYHTTKGHVDSAKSYRDLFKLLMGIPAVEGSQFPASFGHLMGGYDAGYYGYLWSEVYAADMFTLFEKKGLLNPKVGAQYRSIILESGKMKDSSALVKSFLGRKSNPKAFYKKLNI